MDEISASQLCIEKVGKLKFESKRTNIFFVVPNLFYVVYICVCACALPLFSDGANVPVAVSIHYLHHLSVGYIGIVCLDGGSSMCLCVHVHVCECACMRVHACAHMCPYLCVRVCMCEHACACACACTHVSVHV